MLKTTAKIVFKAETKSSLKEIYTKNEANEKKGACKPLIHTRQVWINTQWTIKIHNYLGINVVVTTPKKASVVVLTNLELVSSDTA
jgi:hypothetical protein